MKKEFPNKQKTGSCSPHAFYRVPKALFADKQYKHLSVDARMLYSLMLDRMSLSKKNGWRDINSNVYIFFTLEDIMEFLGCRRDKAIKILAELDTAKGIGLIERVKQGQGKPSRIYVRKLIDEITLDNFERSEKTTSKDEKYREVDNIDSSTSINPISKHLIHRSQEVEEIDTINTNISNMDLNDTDITNATCTEPSPNVETPCQHNDNTSLASEHNQDYEKIDSKKNQSDSSPVVLVLELIGNETFEVTEELIAKYAEFYPTVDIVAEFIRMQAWHFSNPKRKKTKHRIKAHINTWMSKAQAQGRYAYAPYNTQKYNHGGGNSANNQKFGSGRGYAIGGDDDPYTTRRFE